MRCVALVGLPGAGKSALGLRLARLLNRPLIDLDQEIVRREGLSIEALFEKGEARFRDAEARALALSAREGAVLSCGGGAVLRAENRAFLKEQCLTLFLDRPVEDILSDLDASGRPLLRDDPARLYALGDARLPLYREVCHGTIHNVGDPAGVARAMAQFVMRWEDNHQ